MSAVGTVRFRVTALAVLAVMLVLGAAAIGLVTAQRAQLTANLDAGLRQRAADVETLVASGEVEPGGLSPGTTESFTQVLDADGQVIASTPNLADAAPLPLDIDADQDDIVRTVHGLEVDDDAFRVLTRSVDTPTGGGVMHIAVTYDDVSESVGALTTSLAVVVPVAGALLGTVVWWLVGRTLAPVERIRAKVAAIGSASLDGRVPQPQGRDEIALLANTMNDMLDRVQLAVTTQQRFVADASHELRSPLTRLRAQLELLADERTDPGERAVVVGAIDDVVEMQRLVEDLLQLARADSGRLAGQFVPVDLDDIVLREARRIRENQRVSVDVSAVSAAHVLGEVNELRRAIRNLVDNAERNASGAVALALHETDGTAVLTVADDGPGIPAGEREHIFDRFARLDTARSRDSGGTGLGLAITREIIQRHAGTVAVGSSTSGGARFTVTLPAVG